MNKENIKRGQITLETILLTTATIIIVVIIVVILLKLSPTSSGQSQVALESISINKNTANILLSSNLAFPNSIIINYSKIGNSSTHLFAFTNCAYKLETTNGYVNYIFTEGVGCSFNSFTGNDTINSVTYVSNNKAFAMKLKQIQVSYSNSSSIYNFYATLNAQNFTYGSNIISNITTNLYNYTYSIFINTTPISSCQNIDTSSCSFSAGSSNGIYGEGYYTIITYFSNSTYSGKIYQTIYISSNPS